LKRQISIVESVLPVSPPARGRGLKLITHEDELADIAGRPLRGGVD